MMTAVRTRLIGLTLLGALAALALAGCGSNTSPSASGDATPETFDAQVCLAFVPQGDAEQFDCVDVEATYTLPTAD